MCNHNHAFVLIMCQTFKNLDNILCSIFIQISCRLISK